MAEQIIAQGETRELVLINEPEVNLAFKQEAGSVLRVHIFNFDSAENQLSIDQIGEGCVTEIYSLACVRDKNYVRTHTRVSHAVGGGKSKQVMKFVLADEAKGEFFGELKIAKDAQHTEAQQTNRNLLLSERATMRTRPQLEIYADDVKASHGATTGQLDESALFYMQQRCLSEDEGRRLLLQAFMSDVVDTLTNDQQREQVMNIIENI